MTEEKKSYFWLKTSIFFGYIIVILVMITSAGTLPEKLIVRYIGWVIFIVGFIVWLPARIQLRKYYTSLPEAYKIIKTGIYAKIRHPIYIGVELMFAGFSLVLYSLWGLVSTIVLITALHYYRIIEEERLLEERFGKDWLEYKKNTWF
ncbi:MAG TPA: DUF1295 domain-containing protein [Firmicutes bacterium]|nr:MAG: hypothetical protein DRH51_06290 [Candidatus Coatesbacteria bacterium]RLC41770.1 MAG: hypothetical protein DRH44_07075 [Candidatus Coatesbacteria bacterium]RLC43538.1 MAG: hypothetical protein DRH49_00945 [Candidatus Coatesbacteria bacterium]HDM43200.1 DUF1295 domain-containing protein [Bacillota bacterium]